MINKLTPPLLCMTMCGIITDRSSLFTAGMRGQRKPGEPLTMLIIPPCATLQTCAFTNSPGVTISHATTNHWKYLLVIPEHRLHDASGLQTAPLLIHLALEGLATSWIHLALGGLATSLIHLALGGLVWPWLEFNYISSCSSDKCAAKNSPVCWFQNIPFARK